MRKIGTLEPGAIFTYSGQQFVVLEHMNDGVFCLLKQSGRSVPFHNGGEYPSNDYRKSTLRREIEDTWLTDIIEHGAKMEDMVKFDVELCPSDRSDGYGTLEGVYAAPLTLWQYGKYKEIIPLNKESLWWLVTPWACPWPLLPDTDSAGFSWIVCTNGGCNGDCCFYSNGLRPALKLSYDLLVFIDSKKGTSVEGANTSRTTHRRN